MWETLIKLNPKLIVTYKGNKESIFKLALERGYVLTEEDLKKSKSLRESRTIFNEIVRNKPELIKFFNRGSIPTLTDDMIIKLLPYDNSLIIDCYKGESEEVLEAAYHAGFPIEELIEYIKNPKNTTGTPRFVDSSFLFKKVLEKDPSMIIYYQGTDLEVIKILLDKGIQIDSRYFDHLNSLLEDYKITSYEWYDIVDMITDYDVNYVKYCAGKSLDILTKCIDKGYTPSLEELEKYKGFIILNDVIEKFIEKVPEAIKLYSGDNIKVYKMAIEAGCLPSREMIKKHKDINSNLKLMSIIIAADPSYLEFYTGNDKRKLQILAGLEVPSMDELYSAWDLNTNYEVMKKLIDINPKYVECMGFVGVDNIEELLIKAYVLGYRPSEEVLLDNTIMRRNYEFMKRLVEEDIKYIKYIEFNLESEYRDLLLFVHGKYKDFIPSTELAEKVPEIYSIDDYAKHFIGIDPNVIEKYFGSNAEVFELAIKNGCHVPEWIRGENLYGNVPEDADMFKYSYISNEYYNQIILYMVKTKDFSILDDKLFKESHDFKRIFAVALGLGYKIKMSDVTGATYDCIGMDRLKELINRSSKEECINLLVKFLRDEDLCIYINEAKGLNIDNNYFLLLREYYKDRVMFIENFDKYKAFLSSIQMGEEEFTRYGFSISYDWLSDMLSITEKGKVAEFGAVKNWFFSNYFNNDTDLNKSKNFMTVLKNYSRYPELCLEIINNPNITPEIREKIDFLFANNEDLIDENKPKKIDDLSDIEHLFIDKYLRELKKISAVYNGEEKPEDMDELLFASKRLSFQDPEDAGLDDIKDIISKLLFNVSLKDAQSKLSIYGDMVDLRQLMFNNRKNPDICDDIAEMMIYVSMMESIIKSENMEALMQVAYRIMDNIKLSSKCMMLFNQFDDKMKVLFEKELLANMTSLKDGDVPEELLDTSMSRKFGVDVIDFSDKKFCMLYHVISERETPEELVNGASSPEKNTICLSSGSNRNQTLYGGGRRTVFLTDYIPNGVFIRSSVSNMGSDGSVSNHSFEDLDASGTRRQRGILETSYAGSKNSEILCFRDGVKFKYIGLPGGKMPTEEEIEIAKQYGLKFIKLPELETEIDNPKEINPEYLKGSKDFEEDKKLEGLKQIQKDLLQMEGGPKKIAIFSDAHALFEPTLAILTDARRMGISEIYSLGDNVGTGPNPKEVVELLDEFGVVSLKGNHEIYASDGIEVLEEHLRRTGAYHEAEENSAFTRSNLTPEQLEKMKNDPESRVIEIGGKKVLLTHYLEDYTTGALAEIPSDIDEVFQGHRHFESKLDKVTTLRGAGIGLNHGESKSAYYIILTERPEGGYDIEERRVPYDTVSLHHDINESGLNDHDKKKIQGWAGVIK